MTKQLEASIARLKNGRGSIVGAGLLVTEKYVLTCAHVVEAAAGIRKAEVPPAELITLDFPFSKDRRELRARVVYWKPAQSDNSGDIAGLELIDPLPEGAGPELLVVGEDLRGHPFQSFGFPSGREGGVWAYGQMQGRQPQGWVQLLCDQGYRIELGFSGTPIWDDRLNGVSGIAVAADKQSDVRIGFMISAQELISSWDVLRSQAQPAEELHESYVFISYAHADHEIMQRVITQLQENGVNVWVDKRGLKAGTRNWEQTLREAIRGSKAVVLIASRKSRESTFVVDELQIATMYGRTIYPLYAHGSDSEWIDAIPMGLGRMQYFDIRSQAFESGIQQLVQTLNADATTSTTATVEAASLVPPRNPYKGLKPFTEKDETDFFGRSKLIEDLIRRIDNTKETDTRLVAVIGPSGSGKSSVVMAGVLPKLSKGVDHGTIRGSENWTYFEPMLPGNHPIENLALTLHKQLKDTWDLHSIQHNLEQPRGLHVLAKSGLKSQRTDFAVLFIDQFEEIFTQTADEEERRRFIQLITTAATEPDGRLIILITLRADFYDRPMAYAELGQLVKQNNESVLAMTNADLLDVIEKPAKLRDVRLKLDDRLIGDLLFEVKGQTGALPLLQFTLDQLFERRVGRQFTMEAYKDIGGVRGALSKQAEQTYAELPSDHHRLMARFLFLRLIDPGASEQDTTRRRAAMNELELRNDDERRILGETTDRFVNARLLVTGHMATKDGVLIRTIEVAHEALIREWPLLGDWLYEARDDIRTQKNVSEDAAEWIRQGRKSGYLYRATVLEGARAWAKRSAPSEDELAFIEAGEAYEAELKAQEEQRLRELRQAEENANNSRQAAETAERRALQTANIARTARRFAGVVIVVAAVFVLFALIGVFTAQQQVTEIEQTLVPVGGTLEAANAQVANVGQTITPFAATIQAASTLVGNSQTQIAVAQQLTDIPPTLTPIFGTLQVANNVVATANREAEAANAARQTAQAVLELANVQITEAEGQVAALANANEQAQRQILAAQATLTPIPLTLTPVALTLIASENDVAAAQQDVSTANALVAPALTNAAGADLQAAVARTQYALAGQTLTPIPQTLTPVGSTLQAANALVNAARAQVATAQGEIDAFGSTLTPIPQTLTPVGATLQAANSTLRAANIQATSIGQQLANANQAIESANEAIIVANANATAALEQVSNAELTITPFGATIQAANTQIGNSQTQVAVAQQLTAIPPTLTPLAVTLQAANALARGAQTQVANAGETLTPIPLTLTPVAGTLGAANAQIAAAQQEVDSLRMTLTPIPATLTPVGATLAAGNTQIAQVQAEARTAVAQAAFVLTPVQATLDTVNAQVAAAQAQATQLVQQVSVAEAAARESGLLARARALLASRDGSALSAALLSILILREQPSVDAETVLFEALERNNARARYQSDLSTLSSAAFSPDGRRFAAAGEDTVIVWDTFTKERLLELQGHQGTVNSVEFSPDGRLILTASADGSARLWRTEDGEVVRRFVGHTGSVNAASFDYEGSLIVTGGDDGRVILWSVDNERQLRTLFVENQYAGFERRIRDVAFKPDNRSVIAAVQLIGSPDEQNLLVVWNATSGHQTSVVTTGTGVVVNRIIPFFPDQSTGLITLIGGETVPVRSISRVGNVIFTLIGHTRQVTSASFGGDFILTSSLDETAILWDASSGERLQTFAGHGEPLSDAIISPDGRFVVTLGAAGTAMLWDRQAGDSFISTALEATNLEQQSLGETNRRPSLAAYSPDGHYVAIAASGEVQLYSLPNNQLVRQLDVSEGEIEELQFSSDSETLTALSSASYISWHLPGGERMGAGNGSGRTFVGISADARLVGAFNSRATEAVVYTYSAVNGQEERRYPGHTARLWDADISPDGRFLLSGGDDTTARLWDTQISGRQIYSLEHRNGVVHVQFSATGTYAFTIDDQQQGYLWNVASGALIREFSRVSQAIFSEDDSLMAINTGAVVDVVTLPFIGTVRSLPINETPIEISHDLQLLSTCNRERNCSIWNIESGSQLISLTNTMPIHFNPDSRTYIYSLDTTLYISTTPSGDTAAERLEEGVRQGIRQIDLPSSQSIAYSPDGQLLAISAGDAVTIHSARTGVVLRSLNTASSGSGIVTSLEFSPDGIFLAGIKEDRNIAVIWNVETGAEVMNLNAQRNTVNQSPSAAVDYRSDGEMVVTGGSRSPSDFYEVLEWNTDTGTLISRFVDHRAPIMDVAYSPDGRLIASADDSGVVDLWNAGTDSRIWRIQAHEGGVNSLAFSPDGTMLVTGGDDDLAAIWSVETGNLVLSLPAHVAGVTDVAFSNDGRHIVTIGRDSFGYVWDATTGLQVRMPLLHNGVLSDVAFRPDGQQFAIAGQMPAVRIWDVDYRDFVAYACALLIRDISASEIERYNLPENTQACSEQDSFRSENENVASADIATPSVNSTPQIERIGVIIAQQSNVNVRSEPNSSAAILTIAPTASTVTVLGISADTQWINVQLENGTIGWISSTLVELR